MIDLFVQDWELFWESYVTGWLAAVLLALLGVWILARDQVFLGAAVGQASALGIAAALWAATAVPVLAEHDLADAGWWRSTAAIVFSIGAALLTAHAGRPGRESREAVTGWVFLLGASLSVLAVAGLPHGAEEVRRVLSSSLLGSDRVDIGVFAVLTVMTAAAWVVLRRRLLLVATDADMAAAVGMRTGLWGAATAVWLGLGIGLAIKATGFVFTFGCLVLPAMAARNVCRTVTAMVPTAAVIALVTAVAAFVCAHSWNLPPGQLTAAFLCALLPPAWAWRAVRDRLG